MFPGIEGKWCCSAWCFTDCSCPESNTIGGDSGLFYSYAACDGGVVPFSQGDDAPPDSYDASLGAPGSYGCPWQAESSFEAAFLAAGLAAMVDALTSQREVPGINDACPLCPETEGMMTEAAMACDESYERLRKLMHSPGRKLTVEEHKEVRQLRERAQRRGRRLLSGDDDVSALCPEGTAVFVSMTKPCVSEEAYEELMAYMTIKQFPMDLTDVEDLASQGLFPSAMGRAEVATQDAAASISMRQSMGEAVDNAKEVTPEIVAEYIEQCSAEGSTNDPDICAQAEKLKVAMDES